MFLPRQGHSFALMKKKIKYVKGLKVIRDAARGGMISLQAEGITEIVLQAIPVLIPKKYDEIPEDGIYEVDFSLEDSTQKQTDVAFEIRVFLPLKNLPSWVKGIRINAAENSDIELI